MYGFGWRSTGSRVRRPGGVLAGVLALASAWTASRAEAVCSASVCTGSGSACTIAASWTIDHGCSLPLDGYDVTVAKPAVLETAVDGDSWGIRARSIVVLGTLRAPEGTLTIQTTGAFGTARTGNAPGKIEATGGTVEIVAGGPVQLDGTLVAADGGLDGYGGRIAIYGTSIAGSSPLSVKGAGGDGGSIDLLTSETVTLTENVTLTGEINADGYGASGPWRGGSIRIDAGDALLVSNALVARGADDGTGGAIDVAAGTSATLNGNVNASGVGGGTGAAGGRVQVRAGSIAIAGAWAVTGNAAARGGTVLLDATAGAVSTTTASTIDVSGGAAGGEGGLVEVRAAGDVALGGNITANASGTDSVGGTLLLSADGALSVGKTLEARSTANDGARNGLIRLYGCSVTLDGALKTRNPAGWGTNVVRYSTSFTGSGQMLADDDANGIQGNVVECDCPDADGDDVCDAPDACSAAPAATLGATPSRHDHPVPNPCS